MKNTIKLLSNVTEVISVYDTVIVMCNAIPKGKEKSYHVIWHNLPLDLVSIIV